MVTGNFPFTAEGPFRETYKARISEAQEFGRTIGREEGKAASGAEMSRLASERRQAELAAERDDRRERIGGQVRIAQLYSGGRVSEARAIESGAYAKIFVAIAGLAVFFIFGGGIFAVLGKLVSVVPFPLLLGIMLVVLVVWRGK